MSIGSRRLVVGAHYGLRDWLIQRATAIVLAIYVVVLAVLTVRARPLNYESWVGIFAPFVALAWHAWIGMRDIWMDYVRPTALRIVLEAGTILWLAACLVWAVQILWKV